MNKFFRLQEGWLTVGLLALLLFSVTLSIQQAQWADGLSILTPVTIIGLVTGIVTAKVRGVPRFLLDVLGLEVGLITVLLSVASIMHDVRLVTIQDKVHDLLSRTAMWVNVAVRQDVSDDLVVFVLSLAVVTWVLAYSSAYFVFRSRQLWWALVPNGVALLINLSYSPVNLNGYIIIFMFSALLLMIRFNLLLKEERWQRERVNYSPTLTWTFLWAGSAASVLLALAMWWVPASAANSTLNGVWSKVNGPWVEFQNTMSKLWSSVPGNQNIGGYASFNDSFTMGGSLNLGDSVALRVKAVSPDRLYWRALTYDTYSGKGKWDSTAQDTFQNSQLSSFLALDPNQQLNQDDNMRKEITYTVQVVTPKNDVLFAPSRPVKLDTPSRLELSWRHLDLHLDIDCFYRQENPCNVSSVPLELRGLISPLKQAAQEVKSGSVTVSPNGSVQDQIVATSQGPDIERQLGDLEKRGIKVTLDMVPTGNGDLTVNATGEFPVYDDITAIHAPANVSANTSYTAESMISQATDDELRAAGTSYDDWLTNRYLSLPASTGSDIEALARQVVAEAGASTPLDEARAIEKYLRENYEYSTSPGQAPAGVDPIEYFLFQNKKGYCEYYAGAFVIMMRELGVPTRLAAGYAPGTYDSTTKTWTVKESAAHAWPEVFFPGYGWVQFEPTPSQPVYNPAQVAQPTVQVSPTVAGTPAATPTTVLPNRPDQNDAPTQTTAQNPVGQSQLPFGLGGGGPLSWLVLGVVLALALGTLLYFARMRKRQPGPADVYYGRMIRWANWLKLGPAAHQTPYEFSETLARELPGTGLFARTISRAYVRERYSREKPAAADRIAVDRAWDSLRARLMRNLPVRQVRRRSKRRG